MNEPEHEVQPWRARVIRVEIAPWTIISVTLVIAGLCAEGVTDLDNVFHLERGYDDLEVKLAGIGADVERVTTDEPGTEVRDLTGVIGD